MSRIAKNLEEIVQITEYKTQMQMHNSQKEMVCHIVISVQGAQTTMKGKQERKKSLGVSETSSI